MKIVFTTPALKMEVRIYHDPTYDERLPWVVESGGEIQTSFTSRKHAKDWAKEHALADFTHDVHKAIYG